MRVLYKNTLIMNSKQLPIPEEADIIFSGPPTNNTMKGGSSKEQSSTEYEESEEPTPSTEEEEESEEPTPFTEEEDEESFEPTGATGSFNSFLKEKENYERQHTLTGHDYLYPDLNDPNFNIKIATKKEFYDARYNGDIKNIEEYADKMCKAKFELNPHQVFIKNFMSVQTPYKSMLLYHGLGTGKTCSAIGVAEEMRKYLKQTGIRQQIIVVASPNVQDNFRLQLFDEKKLVQLTNSANRNEFTWNIESCVGNSLLDEINPNSIRNLSRERLVSNINSLINEHYSFMGYIQFANRCRTWMNRNKPPSETSQETAKREEENIKYYFNSRLVIIDEVHNIRLSDNTRKEMQQVAAVLMQVVKYAQSMRLLVLSATPMFNSYTEIIWLTNLLNANDKRSQIQFSDVFTPAGEFKPAKPNSEGGEELLRRKLIGYVSYVRGENPYTFPYRVYPTVFSPENALSNKLESYPPTQLNGVSIESPIQKLQVFINTVSPDTYQMRAYSALIKHMSEKDDQLQNFEEMQSFGYIILQRPLEALNIVYPNPEMDTVLESEDPYYVDGLFENVLSGAGLERTMNYETLSAENEPFKHNYEYKPEVLKRYGRFFASDKLEKYSVKMASICNEIRNSEGIVLIYSQYIDGGVVPMALALEEMGFSRYSSAMTQQKSLFKTPPGQPIDAITMLRKNEHPAGTPFKPAQYIMITGDKGLSPSNTDDVKYATTDNTDGSKVKVVIISKAGSEGLDFKAIRQVHILEPWFNINRIEQIIGRGVRNLSHCGLPFAKRNVQIYLHGTMVDGSERETADLYLYRLAEQKGIQIGKITRLLKENAADCILNIGQTNFTAENLSKIAANQNIRMELSSKDVNGAPKIVEKFQVGDLDGSELCDYMSCEFQCKPTVELDNIDSRSYSTANMEGNINYITGRIKMLYLEKHEYTLDEITRLVSVVRPYPIEQILYGLSLFANNRNKNLYDKNGRFGYLVNRGKYYAFQPIEITDERISYYERAVPVEYKKGNILLEVPSEFRKITEDKSPKGLSPRGLSPRGLSPRGLSPDGLSQQQTETLADNREDIGNEEPDMSSDISYRTIVENIESSIQELLKSDTRVSASEANWYKNSSKVREHLRIVHNLTDAQIYRYAVEHYLDTADFNTKQIVFVNTVGRQVFEVHPGIETVIESYFKRGLMVSNDKLSRGILIAKNKDAVLLVNEDRSDSWKQISIENVNEFSAELSVKYSVQKARLNEIIGYVAQFRYGDLVFYYKDIYASRNKTGRRCDRSGGKAPIIDMLNKITNNMYANEREQADELFPGSLCVLMEMLLKHNHENAHGARLYYLTPEQAIYNKITEWSATKGAPQVEIPVGAPPANLNVNAKKCPPGKEIHPINKNCVPVCKPDKVRDPSTGRCVKPK